MSAQDLRQMDRWLNISAVERDTGLSKDTLRMWERRYAFPHPGRDSNGERVYPPDQVEKLGLMKRLMDQGFRPGKIIGASLAELAELGTRAQILEPKGELAGYVALIRNHQLPDFRRAMSQVLSRQGLQRFVLDTVAPLNTMVGDAWMSGRIAVFEEHLYTEQMQGILRAATGSAQHGGNPPRVLLTSLPNEQHGLGLLMVEALLAVEGATCIPLGTETPSSDIVRAARAHRADVVALSFSAAFPARHAGYALVDLRVQLPERFALWAGGSGVARVKPPGGVTIVKTLEHMLQVLQDWRAARGAPAPA